MLYLVGFPNPVTFGLLTVALNYVPYIGPAIIAVVLFCVGLVAMPSLGQALLAPALFVAIATAEGHFITPSIVGRRLTMSPFLVFLALAFWTWLWGPIGAFLAVPLLIVSFVVLGHLVPARRVDSARLRCCHQTRICSASRNGTFAASRRVGARTSRRAFMAATSSSAAAAKSGNGVSTTDIEDQIRIIRDDISELTQQMADLIEQTKDEAMAQVKTQARRAQATAEGAISDLQDKGRETVDAFRDVADTFGDAIEDSLKRRPYATLAVVAGIGFLFGAAWKR